MVCCDARQSLSELERSLFVNRGLWGWPKVSIYLWCSSFRGFGPWDQVVSCLGFQFTEALVYVTASDRHQVLVIRLWLLLTCFSQVRKGIPRVESLHRLRPGNMTSRAHSLALEFGTQNLTLAACCVVLCWLTRETPIWHHFFLFRLDFVRRLGSCFTRRLGTLVNQKLLNRRFV